MDNDNNIETAVESVIPSLEVQVRPIEPKGNLIGFASLKIGGGFVVDDFKVLQGENGIFVGMPSKPDGKGGYRDTARPITKEFRAALTEAVETAYHTAVEKLKALTSAEKKPSIQKQLDDGAAKAARDNAARSAPSKGKKAELE